MTYNEYHKILLTELVADVRTFLYRQKLTDILSSNKKEGYDPLSALSRYDKVNSMLITGQISLDEEVDFSLLGFNAISA